MVRPWLICRLFTEDLLVIWAISVKLSENVRSVDFGRSGVSSQT